MNYWLRPWPRSVPTGPNGGKPPGSAPCSHRYQCAGFRGAEPVIGPGRVVRAAFDQQFELVVSPRLLDELSSVLRRPKFNGFLAQSQIEAFVEAVEEVAAVVADSEPPERIRDPDDDYLVALAVASEANTLVSGDRDLLDAGPLPCRVVSPKAFLDELDSR